MIKYDSLEGLINEALKQNKKIYDIVLEEQTKNQECSTDVLFAEMSKNYSVMKKAIDKGINSPQKSPSGLSGGDAHKLNTAKKQGLLVGGNILDNALIKALAVSEVNACMGKIVAAPTAGSCGIIPAVLSTVKEEKNISDDALIKSLFTAAGIGMVIAHRASLSGAEGGCQAECGSAAAMAAGAAVEMVGGTPRMVGHACAIALKNVLGLVCDPVAGLVEIPCIKRNAIGAANALVAADLALANIESVIPADEVIDAMRSVGNMMSSSLKETAEGGLANTPTAKKITKSMC